MVRSRSVTPIHKTLAIHLIREEFKEHNTKGLCWDCDEKWQKGNQCKHERLLMIEPIEEGTENLENSEDSEVRNVQDVLESNGDKDLGTYDHCTLL
jgi:hypothetical protein